MTQIELAKVVKTADVPFRATSGAAAFDLFACMDAPLTIHSGEIKMVPTGIKVAIPENCCGLVCPRSGLAAKFGITVANAPGVIDSDYRGEINCILVNFSKNDFTVENKMRIAQLLITPVITDVEFTEVATFSIQTERGSNGFGSTGIANT